jgi:hypothetical protein
VALSAQFVEPITGTGEGLGALSGVLDDEATTAVESRS